MIRKRYTERLAFRVKPSTLKELQDVADREDKDLSDIAREMIISGLKWRYEEARRAKARQEGDEAE